VEANTTRLTRAATIGRVGTLLVLAALVIRFASSAFSSLKHEIATLAAQDRVITIRGGDVSLRDAPKAQDLRQGRLLADPYYAGERHWYPFLTPLAAATVSRLTGASIPASFFRAEVLFVSLYLVALAVLAFVLAGWPGLALFPVVFWLGLSPGNGLYPTEAARGAFCLFLAWAGVLHQRHALAPRDCVGLGLAVGMLGLWNGSSFFVSGLLAALLVAEVVRADLRAGRAGPALRTITFTAAGGALPLSLLFLPELLQHGRLAVPDAARTWMAEIYQGGTLTKALTLSLLPRDLHLVLLLLALATLFVPRLRVARALPLLVAYLGALLVAHLGFIAADRAHPLLARAAIALLPAPAHTFLSTAEACRPAVDLLGLLTLARLLVWAVERAAPSAPQRLAPALPLAALAALAILFFTFPYRLTRFSAFETRGFARFAEEVGRRTDGATIFFRYPGRVLQLAPIKILKLSVAEYANPYVHADRTRAEQAIDEALRTGGVRQADAVMDRYGIAFIMEDPRAPTDPVVRRCGGAVLAQHDGYILRKRDACGL
jgi:hypothetical protein